MGLKKAPTLDAFPTVRSSLRNLKFAQALRIREETSKGEFAMLYWALVFLIIAIVAGAVGFGGVAVAFAGLAKIVFFIFLVLLLVSLVGHFRGRGPRLQP
jgi:uncharacterized membrane protein YtjA (UPF0391 family)